MSPKALHKQLPLLHYSAYDLSLPIRDVMQQHEPTMKPNGLWLSVGDAWANWCRDESFHVGALAKCYEIKLRASSKVLRIRDEPGMQDIERRFGGKFYGSSLVHWEKVAKQYDAIVIAPYLWACRLSRLWYYGWDVASGCVWNGDAVEGITEVKL